MRVAVFGAGHVGCVTAVCLARLGHRVWLVEVSPHKLAQLRAGRSPVGEPGLEKGLAKYLRTGRIVLALSEEATRRSELALVCVGTPSLPDGLPDSRQVRKVFGEILKALGPRQSYVLVLRSTLPAPLVEKELLAEMRAACPKRFGREVAFAVNPEFLREGSAVADFLKPPFIIVGTEHPAAGAALRRLYRGVRVPFHVVSIGSASLLKYACNAFHAAKVVFANEVASMAEVFRADPIQVMRIFCQDDTLNISPAYLRPGFAYGGSCLPKDLRALNRLASSWGIACPLVRAVPESNAALIEGAVRVIEQRGLRRIALIGFSFKPDTDDLRESPLVELAERLIGKGFELRIFDPDIRMQRLHGQNLRYIEQHLKHLALLLRPTWRDALREAQLVVIGKRLLTPAQIRRRIPAGLPILDLTREISRRAPSDRSAEGNGTGADGKVLRGLAVGAPVTVP